MLSIYELTEFKAMCADFICTEADINPSGLLDSSITISRLISYLETKICDIRKENYHENQTV